MSLRDNYIFDLDENVMRTSVSYKNRFGIMIAADLYRPKDFDESQEHAAVIVGAPYGGVKEQGPGIYAQNMALRGFVALTFDPSFNGYSGGEPRHLSSPDIFVEDFSAAVDYLGTRPLVDRERIGVIGMCGSGALSLSAAQVDRRIKAVAPVVMYDHHRLYAEGFENSLTKEQRIEFIDERLKQRYADFQSDEAVYHDDLRNRTNLVAFGGRAIDVESDSGMNLEPLECAASVDGHVERSVQLRSRRLHDIS